MQQDAMHFCRRYFLRLLGLAVDLEATLEDLVYLKLPLHGGANPLLHFLTRG